MPNQSNVPLFDELLNAYVLETAKNKRLVLEQLLWSHYGQEVAVFILDMSGFSLLTQRHGIVHYLSMVKRMQLCVTPIIECYRGSIVKFEADNCFATFATAADALKASVEIGKALRHCNEETDDEFDIHVSCGIDFGKILLLDNHDFFGNPVNRASKLGEDIANAGELLISKEAWDLIETPEVPGKPMQLSISGIQLEAVSVNIG